VPHEVIDTKTAGPSEEIVCAVIEPVLVAVSKKWAIEKSTSSHDPNSSSYSRLLAHQSASFLARKKEAMNFWWRLVSLNSAGKSSDRQKKRKLLNTGIYVRSSRWAAARQRNRQLIWWRGLFQPVIDKVFPLTKPCSISLFGARTKLSGKR